VEVFTGQGFDKCEIASASQLAQWAAYSPYRAVNLYVGGVQRGCRNSGLTAALLTELSAQGWRFIPTWVGPQASCTDFAYRMSANAAAAYYEGRAEADAALAVAASLELSWGDGAGTVIYYDLEHYNLGDAACHAAAQAFVAGWTGRLQERRSLAGVYSTGLQLRSFASLSRVPDVIWPAHWIADTYQPDATVWNVYGLPNALWANHQRIRQYAGAHSETWGGVTLNIDSNALDGVAAVKLPALNSPPVAYLPWIAR
jgi:hypothetical protein